ncbi:MAG TPA: ATP-binding protein [Syntrophorhabdaceae bacterium]|nr:ATP-binding protein [Syntrophorhabdaceae bacterium]
MRFDSISFKGKVIHYCAAIGLAVAAYLFRRILVDSIGGELPTYITFYPAVFISALFGGIWAGFLATAASALITAYWILHPVGSFVISSFSDAVGIVLFSCMGAFLSFVAEMYRRSLQKIADYEKKLALRESEERLHLALQAAQAGFWEWDLQTNENHWSVELWRLYGLEPHSTKPSYDAWLQTIYPDDRMKAERAAQQAAKNGTELVAEWRVNDPAGTDRWLMSRGRPLRNESGEIDRYIGIVTDITALKRYEQKLQESEEVLRAANEYLEERVRERTMDLRILTEQLEKSRDDLRKLAAELVLTEEKERKRIAAVLHDEIAQTLAAARTRVEMLQRLVVDEGRQTLGEAKELLSQSIKETRALMYDIGNPVLYDMGVDTACTSLADRLMAMHPIRIRCDVQDSFKSLDRNVKLILFQAIRELLNNAVKHSKAQNVNVQIDLTDGRIRAEVRDDGVGFDPQTLGAPTAEGGFGLYSIRERLLALRGSMQIESSSGTGTVVTVSLPVVWID